MNPENNLGNENQIDSMNSATLGSVSFNNEVNAAPVPEYNNQTNNLSSIGLENLSNNIMNNQQEVDTFNGVVENAPINNSPVSMEQFGVAPEINNPVQQAPVVDSYAAPTDVAGQQTVSYNEPIVDSYAQAPSVEPVQNMGLNDMATANINLSAIKEAQTPSVPESTQAEPVETNPTLNETNMNNTQPSGPTMPIPDSMPDVGYQAGVSTPVDYATPMTNFDEIGTTPDLDPKAKMPGNKKGGKLLVFLLIIILIGALGAGSYYFINIKHIFDKSSVQLKDLVVEQGVPLSENINDYATFSNTSSSNCIQDLSKVDINVAGSYTYTIKCGDKEYSGKITVKDTTPPKAKVKANVIQLDEIDNVTAESFVDSCYGEECSAALSQELNITNKGVFPIKLDITDSNGNSSSVYAPLVVVEGNIHVGLIATKELALNDEYTIVEKDVVLYSDNNYLSYTMYVFTFNNESSYASYLTTDESGKATISDYSGIAVFDSESNKITLVSDVANNLVQGSYSSDMQALSNVGYTAEPFAKDRISVLNY